MARFYVDVVKLALSNKNLNGSTCPHHWEPRRAEWQQLSPTRGNRETWSPEILSSSVSICHVAPWAWNTVEKQYGLNQSYFVTVVNYLESSREKQKCVAKVKIFSLNLHEMARNKDTLCPLLESRGVYFHSGNIHLWKKPLWWLFSSGRFSCFYCHSSPQLSLQG